MVWFLGVLGWFLMIWVIELKLVVIVGVVMLLFDL